MKKLFITIIITGLISFLFGSYIFNVYLKNVKEAIESVTNIYDDVYMLQYGSYNTIEKAKNNDLDNYILKEEDGYYRIYVGITLNEENAKKIKEVYKNKGKDIYIKEKNINSLEFVDYLNNKDISFNNISDDEILKIQNEIINKYKELIQNE